MNIRIVIYFLGWLLDFEGAFLLLPCLVGLIYREEDALYFALSSLICLVLGFIITRFRPKNKSLYAREGFVIVALSWFLLSLFGALPFVMSGAIPSFVDAVFETASGFTTTGATILADVGVMSKAVNFWRTFTHWIGGMGVLVFMMAVVPLAESGKPRTYSGETSSQDQVYGEDFIWNVHRSVGVRISFSAGGQDECLRCHDDDIWNRGYWWFWYL